MFAVQMGSGIFLLQKNCSATIHILICGSHKKNFFLVDSPLMLFLMLKNPETDFDKFFFSTIVGLKEPYFRQILQEIC